MDLPKEKSRLCGVWDTEKRERRKKKKAECSVARGFRAGIKIIWYERATNSQHSNTPELFWSRFTNLDGIVRACSWRGSLSSACVPFRYRRRIWHGTAPSIFHNIRFTRIQEAIMVDTVPGVPSHNPELNITSIATVIFRGRESALKNT